LTLPALPTDIVLSPDEESFLVAVGNDLRSFRVDDGRTRMIFPFPGPITALASQRALSRVLVAQGSVLLGVDPEDRPDRGVLPVRARCELPGEARAIVWTEEGRVAAALV